MDGLPLGRHHKLYSVARSVVIDNADTFPQMDICLRADIHALTGRFPLFLQPYKIGGVLLGRHRRLRLGHQPGQYISHMLFEFFRCKHKAILAVLQAGADKHFRDTT